MHRLIRLRANFTIDARAVRDAVASGQLKGHEKLPAKIVLTVGGVSLSHEVNDEIELG